MSFNGLSDSQSANASALCYNFKSGFVFDGVCDNPDEFVFWDDVHPTDAVHQLIAKEAIETLIAKENDGATPVPEPYGALPLLVIGSAGAVYLRSLHLSRLG